ncbi:alpha/beta fold hydrolase [Chitinophaga nivalis]|uniref:Alpha/beta hydrolase n=1 Tax=Chitinophaga nivalis TaxID=2991709 RepID=A0ABT3IJA0_9BACT|nr:alpha/beta hydrolase [Chitinophaga nivalis]MCW3466290.1 alpha/beta hydrolase [Chitinophaga nivalis]MCW3484019.1 alpha/beta hydrolase [Chitinophaga nivalis]
MKKVFFLLMLLTVTSWLTPSFAQTAPSFKVEIKGTGKQPLVLIPGFACSGEVWEATVQRYANTHKCYIFTMAGFAGTPAQQTPELQQWIKDIAAYIRDNKLKKPVVVGHSMGGGMALALAANYPDLLSKVIVVDALPCLGAIMNPAFKVKENPDCSPIVNQMLQTNETAFYKMQQMTIPQLLSDTTHKEQVIQWSVKSDRKTFGTLYCQFSNTDLRPLLSTITCPSLILLESRFVPLQGAIAEQYKDLKNAQLQYATKGLHFIMYDDQEWFFQQTDNFLK